MSVTDSLVTLNQAEIEHSKNLITQSKLNSRLEPIELALSQLNNKETSPYFVHSSLSDDPTLEEHVFIESIGELINPTAPMFKVKRATTLNKNIVGVLTNINPVKFATHGEVLIKVISGTYQLGDILIPTIDGYGKKATSGEIYDSLFMMIPRAKITALLTNIPNAVSAILL